MAKSEKTEDGDRGISGRSTDSGISTGEAQVARNAGAAEIGKVESARTQKSDGSLRNYAGLADQEESIEICYDGKSASRATKLSERQLLSQAKNNALEEQSKTVEELQTAARINPALDPVLALRQHAETLAPGPQKDTFKMLAKEQAAEILLQGMREKTFQAVEQPVILQARDSVGAPLYGKAEYQENEWQVIKNLPPNYLKELAIAFEAGSKAGQASIHETSDEIIRRTGQSYIDTAVSTAKLPLDLLVAGGKAVWGLLEYDRDLLANPGRARETAGAAGEQVGLAMMAGIKLSVGAHAYGQELTQTGDYGRPFRTIGTALDAWYDRQSPADQMAIMGEICAGFGLGAGAAEVNNLRKPGAFIAFLNEAAEVVPRNPEAEHRAVESIRRLMQQFSREPLKEAAGLGAIEKAGDVVKEAQEKGIADHIMAMAKFFEFGSKESISAEKLAAKHHITKKELLKMTEKELEKHGVERIEKSYDLLFFSKYPHLKGMDLQVHHALPQKLLDRFAGLFKAKEVNSIEYLRGIPNNAIKDGEPVHKLISERWRKFLPNGRTVTREQIIEEVRAIDKEFGQYFVPPVK